MVNTSPSAQRGKVLMHFLVSVDGFVAGPAHDMSFMERTTVRDGLHQEYVEALGAILTGRYGFDSTGGDFRPYNGAWTGPIFVLTHHSEDAPHTDGVTMLSCSVEEALRIVVEAAGGKNVEVFSPTISAQLLERGLIDEVIVHIAPVLLGDGIRLYEAHDGRLVHLLREGSSPTQTVDLRYTVSPS
ncbi:dihydrofolate reductase family protein [Occultella kanbiaonis]|uniref:dihydrofolate reductase family protein n=1 Tax=Occultella kanbiaonis TaxID=2675754 RepID=UPI0013D2751A|nr:dihydrofolate reductase family protein [Occultella kanbiaonis]